MLLSFYHMCTYEHVYANVNVNVYVNVFVYANCTYINIHTAKHICIKRHDLHNVRMHEP